MRSPDAPAPTDPIAINAVLVAVRQAADVVCDRWSLTLILAAFLGERRFGGFQARTGMATRLIATRLRALELRGLLGKEPYSRRPLRQEYHLTPMGRQFFEVIVQMVRWQQNGRADPGEPLLKLIETGQGAALDPSLHCAACGAHVTARDIELRLSRAQLQAMPAKQVLHRRSSLPAGDGDGLLGPSLDLFGDKWSIEIIICAFMRVRRFGDFRSQTGIAGNILTDRLNRMTAAQILVRAADGYRLTERGIDLYGVLVAIQDWADAWLEPRYRSPVRLVHRACGQVFSLPPREPPGSAEPPGEVF